jgi:receptor protein-tyrosine kinase/non-specific protein-tyrosine kinase
VTFQDYVRILRERWLLVVLGAVLGLGGASTMVFLTTPTYAASTTFYIAAPDVGSNVTQAYQGSLLSAQKIKSFTELATDRRIRDQVAAKLGSPIAPGALAASSKPDTVLLTITVTDPSPARALQIASLMSGAFPQLVAEVETPAGQTSPSVTAHEVQNPVLPTSPVSPRPMRDEALGLVLGLLLGLGMAVARHTLDRSVKSAETLAELVGAPVLGSTIFDRSVRSAPLTVQNQPQGPLAESFRQLRTNLQYVDLDHENKLIMVTSPVPGEGKTTTTCNLAIALAQGGAKVALVGADLRRPRAADYLGVENAVGLTSVLTGQVELDVALQPWGQDGIDFLAAGPTPPNPSELLASRQMDALLHELAARYDVVLLDAPPTLPVADAAVLAAQCDGVLFVTRHGAVNVEQVKAAAENLHRVSAKVLGVVLTMAPRPRRGRPGYKNQYQYGYPSMPESTLSPDVAEPTRAKWSIRRFRPVAADVATPPVLEAPVIAIDQTRPSVGAPLLPAARDASDAPPVVIIDSARRVTDKV